MSTNHEAVNAKVDAARAALDPRLKKQMTEKYGEDVPGVTSLPAVARLLAEQEPSDAKQLHRYADAADELQKSIGRKKDD